MTTRVASEGQLATAKAPMPLTINSILEHLTEDKIGFNTAQLARAYGPGMARFMPISIDAGNGAQAIRLGLNITTCEEPVFEASKFQDARIIFKSPEFSAMIRVLRDTLNDKLASAPVIQFITSKQRAGGIKTPFIQFETKDGTTLAEPIVRASIPFERVVSGDPSTHEAQTLASRAEVKGLSKTKLCDVELIEGGTAVLKGTRHFCIGECNELFPYGTRMRIIMNLSTITASSYGLNLKCEVESIIVIEKGTGERPKPEGVKVDQETIGFLMGLN